MRPPLSPLHAVLRWAPPSPGAGREQRPGSSRRCPRPASVKVVRLPGLADGEDVADWIPRVVGDRVGDEARQAVQDELQRLVEAAPEIDLDAIVDARVKPHALRRVRSKRTPPSRSPSGRTRPGTRPSTGSRARWFG